MNERACVSLLERAGGPSSCGAGSGAFLCSGVGGAGGSDGDTLPLGRLRMSSKLVELAAGLPRGLTSASEGAAAELGSTHSRDRALTRAFLSCSCGSCIPNLVSRSCRSSASLPPPRPLLQHTIFLLRMPDMPKHHGLRTSPARIRYPPAAVSPLAGAWLLPRPHAVRESGATRAPALEIRRNTLAPETARAPPAGR